MKFVWALLIAMFWLIAVPQVGQAADVRTALKEIFSRDLDKVDLARVKIEVDRLIDPSINVDKQLVEIDEMVAIIERMLPRNADSWAKVEAIRRFIYEAGPWNNNRAFSYDHDDPYGEDLSNKLLSDYIQDRRGNCITMPFLFIILGQRLGLNVTVANAPLHVFVKFTDDQGITHNLEATSGAGRARDIHYTRSLPITEASVVNRVFMAALNREETVAVIAVVIVESLIKQERYQDAMAVADIVLDHYPNYAYAMVKKSTAAYYLLKSKFFDPYPNVQDVPEDQKSYLAYLQRVNQSGFDKAESLGWRPLQR